MVFLKLLLAGASFAGLCGFVRRRFGCSGTAAPLVTACGVIVLLMLAGMTGLLFGAWCVLYAGGLAAFAWLCVSRREKPDWMVIGALAVALVYACVHFRGAYYTGNDSVSHWGLVVKYLLRTNRFPDESARMVYFRSYPLGATVFIYYLCRTLPMEEGTYLAAQFLLEAIALLPLLGAVRRNRVLGLLLVGLWGGFMLAFGTRFTQLQVDGLLGYVCVGATTIAAQYREAPGGAVIVLLPVMVALVFLKTSGLFFALLLAVQLAALNRQPGGKPLRAALLSAAVILAAFGLWQLYLRYTFRELAVSKHAVSLQNYRESLREKSPAQLLGIARNMARRWIHPERLEAIIYLSLVGGCVLLFVLIRMGRADRQLWISRLWKLAGASLATYLLWYSMVFLAYAFSMPVNEARQLASIERYEHTILVVLAGWLALFTGGYVCREGYVIPRAAYVGTICAVLASAVAFAGVTHTGRVLVGDLFSPLESKPEPFAGLLELRESGELPEEQSYLIFCRQDECELAQVEYAVKYECFSNDIMMIVGGIDREGFDPGAYYSFQNIFMQQANIEMVEDLEQALEANADQYDYLLVYHRDPVFEAALSRFLERYSGSVKILYAY